MSEIKKVFGIIIALFFAVLIMSFIVGAVINLVLPPSEAVYGDEVVVDIGENDFLVATLKGCAKVSEEKIPDASFKTSAGQFSYFDAKNITYVDTQGRKDYLIVWKSTPDKYYDFKNGSVNQYVSAYLTDSDAKCFIEYSYENGEVYGIILGCDNIQYSESDLMYSILGLNRTGFSLSYTTPSSSYVSYDSGNHYHTVIPDRYTLSRTDPGAYYDHYEYGDDYGIDDYLEVEGYD